MTSYIPKDPSQIRADRERLGLIPQSMRCGNCGDHLTWSKGGTVNGTATIRANSTEMERAARNHSC